MTVDHTRVVYSSSFNAYKTVAVYDTTVEVDATPILPDETGLWETTVTVEPDSKFATVLVQANDFNGGGVAAPLRWQAYPSTSLVFLTLGTDPMGEGNAAVDFGMRINGNQVTFYIGARNPYISNIAFVPTSIGVRYAIYTVD